MFLFNVHTIFLANKAKTNKEDYWKTLQMEFDTLLYFVCACIY